MNRGWRSLFLLLGLVSLVGLGCGPRIGASEEQCIHPSVRFFTEIVEKSGMKQNARAEVIRCITNRRVRNDDGIIEEEQLKRCLVEQTKLNEKPQKFLQEQISAALQRNPQLLALESCIYMDCLYPDRELANFCLASFPFLGNGAAKTRVKRISRGAAAVSVAIGSSSGRNGPRVACQNADQEMSQILKLSPIDDLVRRSWRYYSGSNWHCVKLAYPEQRAQNVEQIWGQLPKQPVSVQRTKCTLNLCMEQARELASDQTGGCASWRLASQDDFAIIPKVVIPRDKEVWVLDNDVEDPNEGTAVVFYDDRSPEMVSRNVDMIGDALLVCGSVR